MAMLWQAFSSGKTAARRYCVVAVPPRRRAGPLRAGAGEGWHRVGAVLCAVEPERGGAIGSERAVVVQVADRDARAARGHRAVPQLSDRLPVGKCPADGPAVDRAVAGPDRDIGSEITRPAVRDGIGGRAGAGWR